MYVILAVVYLIVGFIVAIPYCLLAGWDSYNYPAVAILAPGMAFLWFMCGALSGHFHNYGKRVVNFSWWNRNDPLKFGWVFYGWSLYCLLP
ncbi:MAG TPA: hypothetical protein VJ837_00545, partial [Candidatus Paceibacterota bacterium]|nr:hypothetical protein [Candidatus Paceibacterota bacterium]